MKTRLVSRPKRHTCSATSNVWKTSDVRCFYCGNDHFIQRCDAFQQLAMEEHKQRATENKACRRYLSTKHETSACHRTRPCGRNGCVEMHHSLLHGPPSTSTGLIGHTTSASTSHDLMKTRVMDVSTLGERWRCRAFLDEGSSVTLVAKALAEELDLVGPK